MLSGELLITWRRKLIWMPKLVEVANIKRIVVLALNDDTKILTETDTETFVRDQIFPKPKPILFFPRPKILKPKPRLLFRYQIF